MSVFNLFILFVFVKVNYSILVSLFLKVVFFFLIMTWLIIFDCTIYNFNWWLMRLLYIIVYIYGNKLWYLVQVFVVFEKNGWKMINLTTASLTTSLEDKNIEM